MMNNCKIYKINTAVEIRYISKNKVSGLTDVTLVITKPDLSNLAPIIMSEIQPGIYSASFIPTTLGYYWIRVFSVTDPGNSFTDSFLSSYNYGYIDYTLMSNSSTILIDGGVLKSNLIVDPNVLIDGRDISNDGSFLDNHISNLSNPHQVTKNQIGLSNVTNDSQLKRSNGDFYSFSVKNTITNNDLILIEDSEDNYNKKKINSNLLLPVSFSVSDINLSSSTSITYQSKINFNFAISQIGVYLINWGCEITNSNKAKANDIRILLNDTTVLSEVRLTNQSTYSTNFFESISNIYLLNASLTDNNIKLQWKTDSGTSYIRNAHISLLRIR